MDCLLKKNEELGAKAEEGDTLRKENGELKDRIKAVEKEAKAARVERDKSKEVAQKVYGFLGNLGDVLNKALLFDHGLKQPATDSSVKMMRCMVDYGLKMEKMLKELHLHLHPTQTQPEPVGTPGAGPSTTPAPTTSPEFVTPPASQPDPLLQERIPELNTEELNSLRNWAEKGLGVLTIPTTGTGNINPVDLSTPGTASQEHQRREEEHTKRKANKSESESGSSEDEEEESSVSLDSDDEEYQGSDTPSDSGRPKMPPYQVNRPLLGRRPKRGPPASNVRQSGSRSRVVEVGLTKGEEVRSA